MLGTYSRHALSSLQSTLAALADIELEHERELEAIRDATPDLRLQTLRKLERRRSRRRAPYLRKLGTLRSALYFSWDYKT
jgi:hypothetical protein